MRVLMLSPQFRPVVGGYERAAERLSVALVAAGLQVVVITERRDRAWPVVEKIDGYQVRRLFCRYRRGLHTLTSLLSFSAFLVAKGRSFDVWHVHQYGWHAALAVALGRIVRRPVVLKLTNSGPMGLARSLGTGHLAKIKGFLHRHVNACLAVTEETRAEAIAFGIPEKRVHLIPNGVDGRQFRPASRQERMVARDALGLECAVLALFVGRLSSEKNVSGLLDAWAAVQARARDGALLAIVGDGPDRDELYARVRSEALWRTVYLAGHRNDIATWYRAADLYVLSSNNEGLSNSMIEALASGLPIASTRVSGTAFLADLPPAGLLVDVADARSLAVALESLLVDESKRRRLGVNARMLFESRFSLQTIAASVIALYESLLDRRGFA